MTKEEAIKYIKSRCIGSAEERDGTQWSDAMWTAIEALSNADQHVGCVDLIRRQAVIELVKNSYYNLAENMDDVWAMAADVEQIPSAEAEDRLYIKIYADDEPSVMAEKLYQICGETQNGEVAEWIKEYSPSAEPRYTGCSGCVHYDQQQTALICRDCKRSYRDMYKDGE